MKKPPVTLIVAAVLYFGYLAVTLALDFSGGVLGRLLVAAALFYFVFRGSRVAGNILAFLSAISAIVLLVAAVATFTANPYGAAILVAIVFPLGLFSWFLAFSRSMRAFQAPSTSAESNER
jgi:hypothetical protein